MAYPDLCTLADVTAYAPGYDSDATTDALLTSLITAESVEILERTGRELLAIAPPVDPRSFDVDATLLAEQTLWIGDAAAVTAVVIKRNGATVATIASSDYVLLPRVKHAWKPYTRIWFPPTATNPALFLAGDVVQVTGTWGYPSIPAEIKQACAKLVIFDYMNDAASAGTAFAESLAEVNLGKLFRSATEVVERNSIP